MLESIIDYNPELESFKKEMMFLLDMLAFIGLELKSQNTHAYLYINEDEMKSKHFNIDAYYNDNSNPFFLTSSIGEEDMILHISNIFFEMLVNKDYYPVVKANDIDPFNFEFSQKQRDDHIQKLICSNYDYLHNLDLKSNEVKYENGRLCFYNVFLNEWRIIPDALLYEFKLREEEFIHYNDLYYESAQC